MLNEGVAEGLGLSVVHDVRGNILAVQDRGLSGLCSLGLLEERSLSASVKIGLSE